MQRMKNNHGFTIVELATGMVIFSIVLVSIGMFVSSVGKRGSQAHLIQSVKDDAIRALKIMEWDIAHTGAGIPIDLPVNSIIMLGGLLQTPMTEIAQYVISDVNSNSDQDEIRFGGVGMDLSPTGGKSFPLKAFTGTNLQIPQFDAANLDYGYDQNDPGYVDPIEERGGQPVEYVGVFHPAEGWRSNMPMPIQTVITSPSFGDGVLEVEIDPALLLSTPTEGDWVFLMRAIRVGALDIQPWFITQSYWSWDDQGNGVGNLNRQVFADPRDALTGADPLTVLENVVDFQVSFLVWSCNSATPEWVNHLVDNTVGGDDGEFSAASVYTQTPGSIGLADRFMAMRQRLIAIRVSLLIREPVYQPEVPDAFIAEGDTDYELDDHTNSDLDENYNYYPIQQIYDPINLRVKTKANSSEIFPPIRTRAMDLKTIDSGTGLCRGRIVS